MRITSTRLNTFKFIIISIQLIAGFYLLRFNLEIIRSPPTQFSNNHPLQTSFLTTQQQQQETKNSKSSSDDNNKNASKIIISNDKKRISIPEQRQKNRYYHQHTNASNDIVAPSKTSLLPNDNEQQKERHHPSLGHRVPSYMIIGAMKGGTTTLTKLLERHADIFWFRAVKELHFFDSWAHNPKKKNITASLDHFYDHLPMIEVKNGFSNKLIGDSTPRYIIMSDVIPTIKRLCPWVKIIAILRDPIERLFSHYVMTMNAIKRHAGMSLDEYIKADLAQLKKLGLVNVTVDYNNSSSKEEISNNNQNLNISNDEAWLQYIHAKKFYSQILVGRGLYSLQLRQWFKYFPRSSFLIMNYDDLKKNDGAQIIFNKSVKFLGLNNSESDIDTRQSRKVHNKGDYSNYTLDDSTKKMLYNLYEPYNRELFSLLGPEWKDVWKYNS